MVSAKDLKSFRISSSIDTLSNEGRKMASLVPSETLLILVRGMSLFKSIPLGIATQELAINQDLKGLIAKGNVSASFLAYSLLARENALLQMVEAAGHGTGRLDTDALKDFMVRVPPREEQEGIVDVLATWDTAIERTEQLIAAKEDRFLALIDRLVLKPASGKAWKTQKLRDIATRVQRRSDGGGHPVLTISNASGFVLQEEKYKRYMAGESVKDYILLRRGEFAYNKGNSLRFQFGCVYQLHTYDEAIVPHVYVCFRLHDDISSSYLRHLFAVDYLKPQLGKLVKTGIRNNGLLNIRPDEFLGVTVPIPPLERQHRIAEILDAARSEIDLLKRQADAYRTQKRALMQKLLTGQWRVKVPEEANK